MQSYLLKYVKSMNPGMSFSTVSTSGAFLTATAFCFFFRIFSNFSSTISTLTTVFLTFLNVTLLPPGPSLELTTWLQSLSVSRGRFRHRFTMSTHALQMSPLRALSATLKQAEKALSYFPLSVNLELQAEMFCVTPLMFTCNAACNIHLLDLALQMQQPSTDLNTLGLWYELIFISKHDNTLDIYINLESFVTESIS